MIPILGGIAAALLLQPAPPAERIQYPTNLADWVVTQPPKSGDDRWFAGNHDVKHEWVVFLRENRPTVRLRAVRREKGSPYPERQEAYPKLPFEVPQGSAKEGLAGEWFSAQVADGWIIGYNAGEFGAGLWWFSPDGTTRYKISEDQVVGFFKTNAGVFALEGIGHGVPQGRIIRLTQGKDGRWSAEPFVDLKGAPETAVLSAERILTVATNDRLLRVHLETRKVDVLLSNAFWGGLYPKSMIVAPSGTVYLGMRHGVARVEKQGEAYHAKWLLPSREFDRPPQDGFR